MSAPIRDVVIRALHNAAGVLNRPEHARELLAGRDLHLEALDLDSLTIFEVLMEIEDALEVELDADAMVSQESVNGLVAYLEGRVARDGNQGHV